MKPIADVQSKDLWHWRIEWKKSFPVGEKITNVQLIDLNFDEIIRLVWFKFLMVSNLYSLVLKRFSTSNDVLQTPYPLFLSSKSHIPCKQMSFAIFAMRSASGAAWIFQEALSTFDFVFFDMELEDWKWKLKKWGNSISKISGWPTDCLICIRLGLTRLPQPPLLSVAPSMCSPTSKPSSSCKSCKTDLGDWISFDYDIWNPKESWTV